ncbi:MAG TPA: hypothetical protein VEX69_02785 [Candidatus Limnocylindria bacterium]|nr:hypothetical protein [Candidatus Limnocylindria bacterium]
MPDNDAKIDPFKPQQPRIPGVLKPASEEKPVEEAATLAQPSKFAGLWPLPIPPKLILAGIAGALVLGGGIAWLSHGSSAKVADPIAAPEPAQPAAVAAKPPEKLPIAPGEVATTDELAKPWSSKRFIFREPGTFKDTLGIVVHLPDGTFWGLSLREPYGSCELEYVTDLRKLDTEYHFRASHPMVGDPCNKTVFDLTRYGTAPGGLVRGEIAQGAGVRPPMAIEIHTHGKQILGVRME